MGFLGDIGSFIMQPLYYIISVILVGWHELWSLFLDPASGASWALSIVGLTLVIRAALIPLFVKQIKSSRNMQLLQPKVKELLSIPDGVATAALVALGYPEKGFPRKLAQSRKPVSEIAFADTYGATMF